MNCVVKFNICLKCYITFWYIVADKKRGLSRLAIAINDYNNILRKKYKYYSSCFLDIVMTILSSFEDIVQTILSLSCKCKALTISTGTVVLKDLEFGVCRFTVDSELNFKFIHLFLFFITNIIYQLIIYILPIRFGKYLPKSL